MAVVGDGVIGLATVLELARAGLSCALLGAAEPGAGSGAAAGILAPSIGHRQLEIRAFFRRSLDLYPTFLAPLHEFDPDLSVSAGLLEILSSSLSPSDLGTDSTPLTTAEVRRVAPALAGLLREALDAILPDELEQWIDVAITARRDWKRARVPMPQRRPLLLRALDRIYQ